MNVYQSEKGYYYLKQDSATIRISELQYIELRKRRKTSPKKPNNSGNLKPEIGDEIEIIIKPYAQGILKTGIVQKVLTKKKVHTRGHKVMLQDGTVGRTVRIIRRRN